MVSAELVVVVMETKQKHNSTPENKNPMLNTPSNSHTFQKIHKQCE